MAIKTLLTIAFMRFCMVLVLFSGIVCAQDISLEDASIPIPKTQEEAVKQREEADRIRNKADEQYQFDQNECYGKFLVNDCLASAKERHTQRIVYARKFEMPAIIFQREARRDKSQEKQEQREADILRKESEQEKQIQEFRESEARKAAERQQKIDGKNRKVEEHHKKMAAENARRQEKQIKRAKKNAERAAKKSQHDEEKAP